ncbi:SDR family NAD(P)-dependent oxidoreductase [Streptomyces griseoviridis]|uniref:Acyl transferase domain-containing protein/NADP-dependent 3-hydroxy acid dehydrogenase YdfG/acyl carrier protein n=1 Tax=Streptomyces griseoviridis TaxID=45398 RepID=A0ABT9LQ59_STRGD|nr:SDR family NAD(P)-dependent oxidoreductase [Streptomyces griseoviridis]MDP9685684.1 acyl transferase domain-containing protein/NADP-dependent 3-hydroxy acid dehydrogenase YdfG/acyl carrier protein [Streptomyces griseoviridis]
MSEPSGTGTREILGRFAAGELSKREVLALLAAARAAPPAPGTAPRRPPSSPGPAGQAPGDEARGTPEPIAVIGCGARFPGADGLDAFRRVVREGLDTVGEVPPDRWPVQRWYDPDPAAPARSLSRWGGMLEDAAGFDAELFRMTPREAELTDPQARLFLQECWRAVENAGYAPPDLAGTRCGVYAGVMLNDYAHRIERSSPHSRLPQVMQGNSQSILAARVAYLLDLAGPVAAVDTACSSSLVALHQACQALWLGEADMMLAGGVTLYTTELPYIYMSKAGMLSPTGRCRPFDAAADGFVPGEGSAAVLLKPLRRALADGDPVQLVIRASGINHDGASNGLTAPSPRAQTALVRDTYRRFGIDPSTIDYVECHGTGTPLGDPLEISALNDAFAGVTPAAGHIPVGSVKANVGHSSAAAGLAGLFKAMEVVVSGRVPPTPHFTEPNPRIPFGQGPFRPAGGPVALPPVTGRPWRAAVSSFGLSGTNAHVVVEAPPPRGPGGGTGPALVVLSARGPELLTAEAHALADWLAGPAADSDVTVHDVARTLAHGRVHRDRRLAVVAEDRRELAAALAAFADGRTAGPWTVPAPDGPGGPPGPVPEPSPERLYARLASPGPAARDDLLALGRLYTLQHPVDWHRVFPPGLGRTVALPGSVPSARRYWVEEDTGTAAGTGTGSGTAAGGTTAGGTAAGDPVRPVPGARALAAPPAAGTPAPSLDGVSLYVPRWRPEPPPEPDDAPGPLLVVTDAMTAREDVRSPGTPGGLLAALAPVWPGAVRPVGPGGEPPRAVAEPSAHGPGERLTVLVPLPADAPQPCWAPLFGPVREMLTGLWKRSLHLVVAAEDPSTALAAAGFAQSLAHENPRLTGRVVLVDRLDAGCAVPLARECAGPDAGSGRIVDLRAGRRLSRLLRRIDAPGATAGPDVPIRPGGVHLITGGLGGLGLLTARHLVERYGARVVLCGRRPPEALPDSDRVALAGLGASARYAPVDVTDTAAVRALVTDVLATEGALHGVFHAAGVLRDAYLVRKRPEDADEVIGPKADGVRALDAATADVALDLFVLYASVSGTVGNLGQSDYATGNGFLDGFAEGRRAAVARGERSGRTLSVGWPLWRDGGMSVPDAVLATMRERTGAEPLPTATGLAVLEALLTLPDAPPVVAVHHGRRDPWEATLGAFRVLDATGPEPDGARGEHERSPAQVFPPVPPVSPVPPPAAPAPAAPAAPVAPVAPVASADPDGGDVPGRVRRVVSEVTGMPPHTVRMGAALRDLGFDSLTLRALADALTAAVARVSAPEIFAAASLADLAALLAPRTGKAPAPAPNHRPSGHPAPASPAAATAPPHRATVPATGADRAPIPREDRAPTLREDRTPGLRTAPGERRPADALAVVGMSGRYPGAPDLTAFLANLREGRDTSGPVPRDRWRPGSSVDDVRGHFLTGVDHFDADFFGLSPYESALVDPQERLLLETAVEALEDAGALGERLDALCDDTGEPRSVGVFVGVTSSDYQKVGIETWARGNRTVPAGHYWSTANRISYLLDLRGPSQPVDTACSSSLTALHLAAQAIERGECGAALVAGVNLYLHPSRLLLLKEFGFLSPDGRCRSFGRGGTGFGPGEGVGAVVVKPLERALADGDQVYAVVRGTAVGHAGRGHGYTAPSPQAQERVIRRALSRAGVDPATVGLIEAHGTGTELGDPIEVTALTRVFGGRSAAAGTVAPVALGSVKSQIGHGESVAGLAALTKVVLQLRHGELLPTLHADEVNPALDLSAGPFALTTGHAAWPAPDRPGGSAVPRRAGVSSFGAGGVNAHAVLEAYDPALHGAGKRAGGPGGGAAQAPVLVLLRAPSAAHLAASAGRLGAWLDDAGGPGPGTDLGDLAYTLRSGRAEQPCRLACTARTTAELARTLAAVAACGAAPGAALPAGVHINDVRTHPADTESFVDDEALRSYLTALWAAGEYGRVGRLWTQGVPVRWSELAPGGRIVPLPPPVFLRRRIWVEATAPDPGATPGGPPAPDTGPLTGGPRVPAVHEARADQDGGRPYTAAPPGAGAGARPAGPAAGASDGAGAGAGARPAGPAAGASDGAVGGAADGAPGTGDGERAALPAARPRPGYDDVLARLVALVRPRVPDPEAGVDPGHSLTGLGMDSLNLMSLRFAAEEEFGVELPLDLLGGDAPLTALAERIGATAAGLPRAHPRNHS